MWIFKGLSAKLLHSFSFVDTIVVCKGQDLLVPEIQRFYRFLIFYVTIKSCDDNLVDLSKAMVYKI